MVKKCYGCKQELDVSCFNKNRSKPDGLATECKTCKKKQDKKYQVDNEAKIKVKKREYYQANKETIIAKVCQYAKDNRECHNARGTKSKNKNKQQVLGHYSQGRPRCNWCSCEDVGILTIDHIEGNGAEHRRELYGSNKTGGGSSFYFWLKKNGYPEGYQVLCFNCQYRKRAVELKPENPTHLQLVRAKYARSVKIQCLEAYGGCSCPCGETDMEVLTLDHVNDDGADHRRETNTRGYNFYIMLRKNGFPTDPPLQTLCLNCQITKRNLKYEQGTGH